MSVKQQIKRTLLGEPGLRERRISRGLLRGLNFHVDTATKGMRLIGFDEKEIERDVRRLAARAKVAADVGMNDGWYTVFFASCPQVQRIYGFEPETSLLRDATANLRLNGERMLQKTVLVGKFVGDKNDEHYCSLDETITDAQRPILLKIDVDGGELEVLHGARRIIEGDGCLLVIETHSPQLEKDCIGFLEPRGYTCRVIGAGWYRTFLPEARELEHNQWLIAVRPDRRMLGRRSW